MSFTKKILCEIKKSVRLIDNEFSSIKKLLLLLDNDKHTEFNRIVDAFSEFYVNRLTFNVHDDTDAQDVIEIDMNAGAKTETKNETKNEDTSDLLTPEEMDLKISEEMRSIIDSRRANLEKVAKEPPHVAPIRFRETVACEPVESTSSSINTVNALLKLLGDSDMNMDTPTIDEDIEEVIEEVIEEEVKDVAPELPIQKHLIPDVITGSFSHKVMVPPIPRVYTVPPVKFTSPDKLPESFPQVAPLFKLSLQQRNRMFEKFYKTAKLTVEELTKNAENKPTDDEKNKMIRDECDRLLEDYLAGGVDTLDQTEL